MYTQCCCESITFFFPGEDAFKVFLDALEENGYKHLAKKIRETDIEVEVPAGILLETNIWNFVFCSETDSIHKYSHTYDACTTVDKHGQHCI